MARLVRVDFAVAPVVILDRAEPPTISRSTAITTPEGYLLVDAYTARDGKLRYSNDQETWIEYRPRSELVKAAASWQHQPVTDDHPSEMVSAATWATVARGVHADRPTIEGPLADGNSYMRARLLVTDAKLIGKMRRGDAVELSIGFSAEVVETAGGVAADGTRCDAVQTELQGNHTAVVRKGRAGPNCRVVLDGAHVPCHTRSTMLHPLRITIRPLRRADEVGAPTDMVPVIGPDGQEITLPSWAAAMLAELQALKSGAPAAPAGDAVVPGAPAPAPVAAAPVGAPVAPAAAAAPQLPAPAAPALPVAPAADAGAMPANPPADPEKAKTMDAAEIFRPMRRRLDRLAAAVGVPESVLDSEDPTVVARAYLAKAAPQLKVDAYDARQLATAVDVASQVPALPRAPFGPPPKRTTAADADPEVLAHAKRLISEGVR